MPLILVLLKNALQKHFEGHNQIVVTYVICSFICQASDYYHDINIAQMCVYIYMVSSGKGNIPIHFNM